jgi:cytochrome c peroxidase
VLPQPVASLEIPSSEPLAADVLLGKQLFNDSFDPRLARDGYIACAHCHLDGEADGRTWDFTDRGEGLRNTISLLGRAGVGHGPIHWSANFDEVQDFENDIRNAFGGTGLLAEADWRAGTTSQTLGDPKAGLSADLDALAAYVTSLATYPASPFRAADGSLSPDAAAGEAIFDSLGCGACHSGAALTDSTFLAPADPLLHDVGTITEASGQRLGGPLLGLDTPTLHELWNTAPYLHDGSAASLLDVLTTKNPDDLHGATSSLSPTELDQLVAYLRSIE